LKKTTFLQKKVVFSILTILSVQVNAAQETPQFRPLTTPAVTPTAPAPVVQQQQRQQPMRYYPNPRMMQPQYRMPPPGYYRGPMYGNGYPPPNWRPNNNRGNRFFGNPFFGNNRGNNRFFNGNWMNFSDPKGTMSRGWDEMLDAPSQMGEMPGGWNAPSISVPNPIEVGDQFQDAAQDLPTQMRNMSTD